jgi:hypothetical protein
VCIAQLLGAQSLQHNTQISTAEQQARAIQFLQRLIPNLWRFIDVTRFGHNEEGAQRLNEL